MRALILTSKIGEGHNSCAQALQEAVQEDGGFCTECEALGLLTQALPRWMSALHTHVYRSVPSLFRAWYRYMERPTVFVCKYRGVRYFFRKSAEHLLQRVTEGQYDTIVCTHIIAALIVTEMLDQHPLPVRTYFVATDYTCSPGTRESRLGCYFIPAESLREEFASRGIPAEKIAVGGIPIRQAFYARADRGAAKRAFGVLPEHQHVAVMCGSMGCGPMKKLAAFFARSLSPSQEATFVCGTNRKLYQALCRKYAGQSRIHVAGYVDNVSLLLDSADLYLTKPGGLSVTEAAAKSLPMVLLNVVAGCENYNLAYFTKLGAAATAGTLRDVAELCLRLLRDDGRREEMAAAYGKDPQRNSAREICARIRADIGEGAPPAENSRE